MTNPIELAQRRIEALEKRSAQVDEAAERAIEVLKNVLNLEWACPCVVCSDARALLRDLGYKE